MMQPGILFMGLCMLVLKITDINASRKCYEAKICIHNGQEKCGVDEKGNLRRFLDSCDLKEFNCLRNTDYVKTALTKCWALPPINETKKGPVGLVYKKKLAGKSAYLQNFNGDAEEMDDSNDDTDNSSDDSEETEETLVETNSDIPINNNDRNVKLQHTDNVEDDDRDSTDENDEEHDGDKWLDDEENDYDQSRDDEENLNGLWGSNQ